VRRKYERAAMLTGVDERELVRIDRELRKAFGFGLRLSAPVKIVPHLYVTVFRRAVGQKTRTWLYLGSCIKRDPWSQSYLGGGVRVVRAIKRYGREHFVRVPVALRPKACTQEAIRSIEALWLTRHDAKNDVRFYNLTNFTNGDAVGGGRNGGQVLAARLANDPELRAKYQKMGRHAGKFARAGVERRTARERADPDFARYMYGLRSQAGLSHRIAERVATDEEYRKKWCEKSRIGGRAFAKNMKDPVYRARYLANKPRGVLSKRGRAAIIASNKKRRGERRVFVSFMA